MIGDIVGPVYEWDGTSLCLTVQKGRLDANDPTATRLEEHHETQDVSETILRLVLVQKQD